MRKRFWFMHMLLLCMMLFSSCAVDGAAAETFAETGEFRSVTQDVFPDAPPMMTVVCGEEQIIAWRGTYSWETVNALGIGQAVQADSMHPLDAARDYPEEFPVLHISEGESVELYFDALYDSRTVRYYPDGWDSYDAAEIHTTGPRTSPKMQVKTGLYEIIAEWNDTTENYSGTVHYAFRVYDPYRVVGIAYETGSADHPVTAFERIYEDAEYSYYLPDSANGEDAVTYANGDVVRIKDAAAAGHITLTDLLQEQIYCFMISKVMPEPTDSDVLYIIDRSEGQPFSDVKESFFEDDNHIYTFGVPKIGYVTVVYRDGRSENVRDALDNGSISISDLDRFGIQYYADPKTQ